MSAWSSLPNAAHIDRVLAHVQAHPDKWNVARDAARVPAREAARDAVWRVARLPAREAAREAARGAVWRVARGAAWSPVWDACVALIAWDKAGDLVGKNPQQLIALSAEGVHAATLLLPASIAMEKIA